MSNVINFPVNPDFHPPQTEAELQESVKNIRQRFVTQNAVDIAFDVFQKLESMGIQVTEEEKLRYDLILISESIKSAMFRSLQMKHPLQEFSENIINLEESDISFEPEE